MLEEEQKQENKQVTLLEAQKEVTTNSALQDKIYYKKLPHSGNEANFNSSSFLRKIPEFVNSLKTTSNEDKFNNIMNKYLNYGDNESFYSKALFSDANLNSQLQHIYPYQSSIIIPNNLYQQFAFDREYMGYASTNCNSMIMNFDDQKGPFTGSLKNPMSFSQMGSYNIDNRHVPVLHKQSYDDESIPEISKYSYLNAYDKNLRDEHELPGGKSESRSERRSKCELNSDVRNRRCRNFSGYYPEDSYLRESKVSDHSDSLYNGSKIGDEDLDSENSFATTTSNVVSNKAFIENDSSRCRNIGRKRKDRIIYNQEQIKILEDAFKVNKYPDIHIRTDISTRLGIDECRVQVWFKNRRARIKKTSMYQYISTPNESHDALHDYYYYGKNHWLRNRKALTDTIMNLEAYGDLNINQQTIGKELPGAYNSRNTL